jgi:hypothetical protein
MVTDQKLIYTDSFSHKLDNFIKISRKKGYKGYPGFKKYKCQQGYGVYKIIPENFWHLSRLCVLSTLSLQVRLPLF